MQCLPELRCMFLHRNSLYDADHGRGTWPCASGNGTDAGNQPGSPCVCKRGGKTGDKTGKMEHMRPSDIVTMESFENAILVHAAISGSTNCLLHLPAIAHEFGIEITGDTFDRLHRNARYLLDVRPEGRWPAECFYYAGGVPAIMEEIKEHLHLDVMTVTGKTLGENLEELKQNGFYEKCEKWLQEFNRRYQVSLTKEDIIRPYEKAIGTDGSIAVLRGNLAPEGAVIKHTACPKEMFQLCSVPDRSTVKKNAWMLS